MGHTLLYCAGGQLASKACGSGTICGWNASFGMYMCGAGLVTKDPTGAFPRECQGDFKVPAPDLPPAVDAPPQDGAPDGPSVGCGPLSFVGCCTAAGALHFCVGSQMLALDCTKDPACGWNPQAGYYSCGTKGQAEPSGVHPISCAALLGDSGFQIDGFSPADLGADQVALADLAGDAEEFEDGGPDSFTSTDGPPTDQSGDGARDGQGEGPGPGLDASGLDVSGTDGALVKPGGGGGCSGCAMGGSSIPPGAWHLLSMLGAVFFWTRQRRWR